MAEPAFVAETLAWCNSVRAEKGMGPLDEMPKGRRHDPMSCPCGKATGAIVQTTSFYLDDGRRPLPAIDSRLRALPLPVIDFIREFDEGLLPQYVEQYDR